MTTIGPDAEVKATDPDGCRIPIRRRYTKGNGGVNYAGPTYKPSNEDWFCEQCLLEWGYTFSQPSEEAETKRTPPIRTHLRTFGFGGDETKMHTFKQV